MNYGNETLATYEELSQRAVLTLLKFQRKKSLLLCTATGGVLREHIAARAKVSGAA